MTQDDLNEMFGGDHPFSDFFETFFGGAGQAGGQQARTRGAPRAGRAPGPRPGAGDRALARGRLSRRDAPLLDPARRRSAQRRRPHSRRRRRRLARPRRGRRRTRAGGAQGRRPVPPDPHARRNAQFERKGRDLYTHVPIPLTTAVLGGEAEVKTIAGKSLRLKVPPTTQNAQVFRLKGHGMPATGKTGESGDLYATVDVQLPRELTPEQRAHFEALQKLEGAKSTVRNSQLSQVSELSAETAES